MTKDMYEEIDFYAKVGDEGTFLTATLEDAVTGLPVDLTDFATVKVTLKDPWSDTTLLNAQECTIEAPSTSGVVTYEFLTADLDVPGLWLAEFLGEGTELKQRFPNDGYFRVAVVKNLEVASP